MKHIVWVRYILMALSVLAIIFGWAIWGRGDAAGDSAAINSGVNILLNWLYVMLSLGVGAMILMSVLSLAQNPKSAVQALIGLAGVVVVIGVAWALSSAEPVTTPTQVYAGATELKVADTSLFAMYACLAVAVLSILALEVRNAFK